MNKQELIERIEGSKNLFGNKAKYIEIDEAIELIEQLDEPQKPVVPQYVADWIEKCKSEKRRLHEALTYTPFGVNSWVSNPKNQETFALGWINGYTVEKEPKYTVKCKATKQYLSNDELGPHFDPNFRSNFTKSDFEKLGLDWVLECEGMEVEKVGK